MEPLGPSGRCKSAWSLLLLAGSVNAACTGYRPPRDIDVTTIVGPRMVEGTPLEELWTRTAGRGLGGAVAYMDTVIYFGAADRHVIAVDLRNGAIRWRTRVPGPIAVGTAADDRRVYTHTERPDGRVYALDRLSGSKLWGTQVGPSAASPALIYGTLVVATRAGMLLGLDPANGKIKWRRSTGEARSAAVPGDQGTMLLATVDSLFRISSADGRVLERSRSPGTILSGWAVHREYRIAGTTDSLVIGIRPGSLARAWSLSLDAPVIATPVVRGDTAWVFTRIGTLFRILLAGTPVAERLIALRTPFLASPTLVGDWLVAGDVDGELYAITLDGTIAWQTQIAAPVEFPPLLLPDGFLAVGGRGDLHRYRL
jgi:outer membrane protein assembly factor BamB